MYLKRNLKYDRTEEFMFLAGRNGDTVPITDKYIIIT